MTDEKAKYLLVEAADITKQKYKHVREFRLNDFFNFYDRAEKVDANEIFANNGVPEECRIIIVKIIGSLFIKVPKMADISALPLFIISVVESFLINWLIAALFGMIAFTAINIDALIQVKKHLLRLLSGSIIPVWFFPEKVANVLEALPFVYIYQLPLSIYIGKGDRAEQLRGMGIQFVWLVLLAALFLYVQKRATRKVMVQGG